MSRSARGREPRLKPVERIELSENNTTKRLVAVCVLIVLAVGFFAYGASQLFSRKSGWTEIEPKISDEMSCASEFVLQYDLGRSGSSATVEYKAIAALYGTALVDAYRTYHPTELFSGSRNLASLNRHPNEVVELDEQLYAALTEATADENRLLYLAPIYEQYDAMFACEYDYEAENFDPAVNADVRAYVREALAFANDPDAVSLELLPEGKARLNVSEDYLRFAEENEITAYLDFFWMKNAFIADDIADALEEAGYTLGMLTSYDGYARCLGGEGSYSVNICDRVDGLTYPAAVMQSGGARAIVSLRSYPANERDELRFYTYADGAVRTPYVDPSDGLCRTALNDLTGYSKEHGCAAVTLALAKVYIGSRLDVSALKQMQQNGIETVFCRDRVIVHSEAGLVLESLFSGAGVQYTEQTLSDEYQ